MLVSLLNGAMMGEVRHGWVTHGGGVTHWGCCDVHSEAHTALQSSPREKIFTAGFGANGSF